MSEGDVYWIESDAQYECLMSSRRMDIVDLLANVGARSVSEMASLIGVKPSSLYHHVALLLQVGLIELAGTRSVHRRQEKLYKTPGTAMRYGLAFDNPKAIEVYTRLGEVQARQAVRDFRRGFDSGAIVGTGPAKNVWIFRLVGSPDPETMAKINHHIEEIAKLFWGSTGQGNPLIVMSAMMAPLPRVHVTDD